ncbi:MAG TPA: DUF1360 domain-containing protein [Candidatus Paceibacterota bacterium]|nr:DUF1360 domain-containing protein [Candidatus Paceibacterota bacterium]
MNALWNILYSVFFLALVAYALIWLTATGQLVLFIPAFHIMLLSLATFRLIRLFTYDHITAWLRDWFSAKDEGTFLGTAGRLLTCPWCTGVWFAFLVYLAYAVAPLAMIPLAIILSISAIASFLQLLSNLVGWSAEAKKREAKGRE